MSFPRGTDLAFKWLPTVYLFVTAGTSVKTRSTLIQKIKITFLSELLVNVFVESLKKIIHRRRPGKLFKFTSFPSSHTATSFCTAQIAYEEIKDHSEALGVAGYSFALTTAVLRLNNKKHWFSDVVAGAIIGIVSAKLSYLIFKKL